MHGLKYVIVCVIYNFEVYTCVYEIVHKKVMHFQHASAVRQLISSPSSLLSKNVRRKHWNNTIRPLPISGLALHAERWKAGWELANQQGFWGHFFLLLQEYITIIENLPTPTAGIPFVRLDPYLVPPDGLYGGPKSLPDGGESSLISGELSSTLQMGKSNSPFMWRTRPTRSGYRQLKTRYIIKHYNNI